MSDVHAERHEGVEVDHIYKVRIIDIEQVKDTLEITTHKSVRTNSPKIPRNYITNDCMIRYKRINEYFYMDNFFATKKSGKSMRQNIFCQIFVTYKGFVYVVPVKSKSDALKAVKQSAKEIGAPYSIIAYPSKEHKSKELRYLLTKIGSTIRSLYENIPWANKAELYIGITKESAKRYMKKLD